MDKLPVTGTNVPVGDTVSEHPVHLFRGGQDRNGQGGNTMAHNFESRPWGSWHVLDEGEGYKVKRLEVKPQQRLSYQTHAHRAELWIVVSGVATCVIEGREVVAIAGDSVAANSANVTPAIRVISPAPIGGDGPRGRS